MADADALTTCAQQSQQRVAGSVIVGDREELSVSTNKPVQGHLRSRPETTRVGDRHADRTETPFIVAIASCRK